MFAIKPIHCLTSADILILDLMMLEASQHRLLPNWLIITVLTSLLIVAGWNSLAMIQDEVKKYRGVR